MNTADALFAAIGLALIAWGGLPSAWQERRHADKLRDRQDRGYDRYHDEARALAAYTPKQRRRILRGIGTALLTVGVNGWLQG